MRAEASTPTGRTAPQPTPAALQRAGRPLRVLLLTRYGSKGASSRLRMLQYVPLLESRGFSITAQGLLDDDALQARYRHGRYGLRRLLRAYGARIKALAAIDDFDLAWVEKEALPWFPASWERHLTGGVPVVLDFDDAVFHTYDRHRSALVRTLLGQRIDSLMRHARTVVAGNAYLAARARAADAASVALVPSVVDLRLYEGVADHAGRTGVPRIAWIGSPSTVHYLRRLAAPLRALAEVHPFRLRVIGGGPIDMPGVEVESIDWDSTTEALRLRECDIGIMPLPDGPWERGKCGFKLVQYMACGLPVVASAVGANIEIVAGRDVGRLARTDDDWTSGLAALISDPSLRRRQGTRGRREVERHYSVQAQVDRIETVLREAAA